MTRSVCGSARPPEAGRSPAAFDASAERKVTTASGVDQRGAQERLRLALRPGEPEVVPSKKIPRTALQRVPGSRDARFEALGGAGGE